MCCNFVVVLCSEGFCVARECVGCRVTNPGVPYDNFVAHACSRSTCLAAPRPHTITMRGAAAWVARRVQGVAEVAYS